jgi:uncharacterized protein YrrD
MRLSNLQGKRVRRESGEVLGHVFEVHSDGSRVTALTYGARGLLQRFLASHSGHRVLWQHVLRVSKDEITVSADAQLNMPKRGRRTR